MSNVADSNQFSALASPIDDSKQQEGGLRARFGKDDIKEQAYQARESLKSSAIHLKEQVMKDGVATTIKSNLPTKASVTATIQPAIDAVREKVGLTKSIDQTIDHSDEAAEGDWEEVKSRKNTNTKSAAKKAVTDAIGRDNMNKLNKAGNKAKKNAAELQSRAENWTDRMLDIGLSNPRLRPIKSWIQRNNLQLPAVLLGSLLTLWLGLSLIRLVAHTVTPSRPEFDIHSADASSAWLKYHAGEFKGRALDKKDDLTARAAKFLANYEYDNLKSRAIDYKDIGMSKLGLQEPTWGEWAWAKLTGRPITWQERVDNVMDLAKAGIYRPDILTKLGLRHEPTLGDRLKSHMPNMPNLHMRSQPVGYLESWRLSFLDGVESIREMLPGGAELKAARLRAMAAAKPSTLDNIKSTATYVKNRIVHGSEEAKHIMEDNAKELADKARYKAGL